MEIFKKEGKGIGDKKMRNPPTKPDALQELARDSTPRNGGPSIRRGEEAGEY